MMVRKAKGVQHCHDDAIRGGGNDRADDADDDGCFERQQLEHNNAREFRNPDFYCKGEQDAVF